MESRGCPAEFCELPRPRRMGAEKGHRGQEGRFGAQGDLRTPEGHCMKRELVGAE